MNLPVDLEKTLSDLENTGENLESSDPEIFLNFLNFHRVDLGAVLPQKNNPTSFLTRGVCPTPEVSSLESGCLREVSIAQGFFISKWVNNRYPAHVERHT